LPVMGAACSGLVGSGSSRASPQRISRSRQSRSICRWICSTT
jgi:hypothetical protein